MAAGDEAEQVLVSLVARLGRSMVTVSAWTGVLDVLEVLVKIESWAPVRAREN